MDSSFSIHQQHIGKAKYADVLRPVLVCAVGKFLLRFAGVCFVIVVQVFYRIFTRNTETIPQNRSCMCSGIVYKNDGGIFALVIRLIGIKEIGAGCVKSPPEIIPSTGTALTWSLTRRVKIWVQVGVVELP